MRDHATVLQRCLGAIMGLAGTMAVVGAFAASELQSAPQTQTSNGNYNPDWAIVSAPPPPGPYQSVNIDPRVPGQEVVKTPFVSGPGVSPPGQEGQQGDYLADAPPAAGLPTPTSPGAYPGSRFHNPEPPPGYYGYRGYNPSQPAPVPGQMRSYAYPHRQGYPPNGYAPSPWTNNLPAQRTEEEVPPPPAYNRMSIPPAPEQFYRRGSGTQ